MSSQFSTPNPSIDQSTPGTTNNVNVGGLAPTTQTLNSAASGAAVSLLGAAVVTVQITAYSGDGLMRGQVSNDGTTWTDQNFYNDATGLQAQNIAATGLFTYPTPGHRYFRLNMVSWSSGSTTAIIMGGQGVAEGVPVNTRSNTIALNSDSLAGAAMLSSDGTNVAAAALQYAWNGTANDRWRNNLEVALLASASRTTTQTSADITNYNGQGIHVVVSTTTIGTGSITFSIQGKDANGIYYTILTGAAIVTDTVNRYTVFPTASAVANVSVNDILPRTFRIIITANNANPAVYSVGYNLVV